MMDLYLMQECRFFLGQNSGPSDLAVLFGRPLVLVNLTEWTLARPLRKGDRGIVRHVFSTELDRYLSIQEILDAPLGWQSPSRPNAAGAAYVLVHNTPEEIRDVVNEYLEAAGDAGLTPLQAQFNERRAEQIKAGVTHLGEAQLLGGREQAGQIAEQQFRVAARATIQGSLGQRYLEQNWDTDNLERRAPS